MIEKIKELLLPSALKNYKDDFARDNFIFMGYLIYLGLAFNIPFTVIAFLGNATLPIKASAVEYLIFFLLSACIRFNYRHEMSKNGTVSLYVWSSVLLMYTAIIFIIDGLNRNPFSFLFFLILVSLLTHDAWGRIIAFDALFSLFFAIAIIVNRSGDERAFGLLHLSMTFVAVVFLSGWRLRDRIMYMSTSETANMKAEHDVLTGILNRRGGEHLIDTFIRNEVPGTFIIIDVDDFKHINDTYGHAVGDETLKMVAMKLKSTFRDSDVIMRMGGDEFIVYAVGMADMGHVEGRLMSLKEALYTVTPDKEQQDHVTASIGAIINLGSYSGYQAVYTAADKLLYSVKMGGKDGFKFSDKEA